MKADALFKMCLLACSILTGRQVLADPIMSAQSPQTVNSIDFSYMNYSRPPESYFNRRPPPFRGLPPAPAGPTGTPPLIETPAQSPVVAAVPEPGTFALLGLGFVLLIGCTVKKIDSAE